jgi:hypothetical protein
MNNMILWGNQSCLWIIHQNDITGVVGRVTDVNALIAAFLPFPWSDRSILKGFVEDIDWRAKNFEIMRSQRRILISEKRVW